MNVVLDRLPQPRVVIGFELTDRPKDRFWLLLQNPEAERARSTRATKRTSWSRPTHEP